MKKKSKQKAIKKLMHLGIDFWKDFDGFWKEKWRQVGTKIDQKSMPTSKSDFLKKPYFSLGKTTTGRSPGVEVGSKNRLKIYAKNGVKKRRHLGIDFSWI